MYHNNFRPRAGFISMNYWGSHGLNVMKYWGYHGLTFSCDVRGQSLTAFTKYYSYNGYRKMYTSLTCALPGKLWGRELMKRVVQESRWERDKNTQNIQEELCHRLYILVTATCMTAYTLSTTVHNITTLSY